MKSLFAAVAALCLLGAGAARADEVVFGGFQHAADLRISGATDENGVDLEASYRTSPIKFFSVIGSPRAYALLSVNLEGNTSFASAGLLWRKTLIAKLYGQAGLGGAYQNGIVVRPSPSADLHRIAFGSRELFQPELDIGWMFTPRFSMEGSYVHISNAGLGKSNPGMDDLGIRVIYRFGGK